MEILTEDRRQETGVWLIPASNYLFIGIQKSEWISDCNYQDHISGI
jgi:hypothetical protein